MNIAPMPRSVKVGPHNYTVLRRPASEIPKIDGNKVNAYCDKDALKIVIAERLRASKNREFLLHELLHAVFPDGFDEVEEKIVLELSIKLLQLIRDNEDLIEYLRK